MTEHAPDRFLSGIDVPKTIAGVLAAVSAAVIGSFLGVAGTLAGAAVASLIGSIGTEVYHRSIKKGHQRLQGTFTTAPAAVGTPPVAAAEEESPSTPEPAPRRVRWGRVAMVAGSLFVLAMGTLTVAELVAGKSIADATRGHSGSGSTISDVFSTKGDKSDKPVPGPASESPAVQPGKTGPTQGPASAPPTTEPTTPADTPQTDTPQTDAPTTEAPADGSTGQTDTKNSDSGSSTTGTE